MGCNYFSVLRPTLLLTGLTEALMEITLSVAGISNMTVNAYCEVLPQQWLELRRRK
jgi:hypothetical protein